MNFKNQLICASISILLMVLGFLGGYFFAENNFLKISKLALMTTVVREDLILTKLENEDVVTAKKIQTENLKFSLLSLDVLGGAWPENINLILEKRKSLMNAK